MSASEIAVVNEKLSAAIASGDAAAAAALYTEDGCFLASNMDFLRGRAAIQQFLQGILDMGVKELKLETLELETFGDTAVQVGTYELLAEGGAQASFDQPNPVAVHASTSPESGVTKRSLRFAGSASRKGSADCARTGNVL